MRTKRGILMLALAGIFAASVTGIAFAAADAPADAAKAEWECLAGDSERLTAGEDGFVYDKAGSADPTVIATKALNISANRYAMDIKIEADADAVRDFVGILAFRVKDRNQATWGGQADGLYLQFGLDKTILKVYEPGEDGTARLELPFSVVDGQAHRLEVLIDDAEGEVSVLFDHDPAARKFVMKDATLEGNASGALYYMARSSVTTVTDFTMEEADPTVYPSNVRFVNDSVSPAQYLDFAAEAGADVGSTTASVARVFSGIIGADPVKGFADDVVTMDVRVEETDAGYFVLNLATISPSLNHWDAGNAAVALQAETGKAVALKWYDNTQDPSAGNEVELPASLNLLDGQTHRVRVELNRAESKVVATVDGTHTATLTDARIPAAGGYNVCASKTKVHISNFAASARPAKGSLKEEVPFSPAITFSSKIDGEDASTVAAGDITGHMVNYERNVAGQPAVRSAASGCAADLFTFRVSKKNTVGGYGIVVLRAADASLTDTMPWGTKAGLKLQFNVKEDGTDPLTCNTDGAATNSAEQAALYFANINDGAEHTVTVRIYDDRTQKNVAISMDGRQVEITVANLPKVGGVYMVGDGSAFNVTGFAAYKTEIAPASIALAETEGAVALTQQDKTLQISATVLPANATNKAVSFTSDDETVATVSDTGLVTALKVGTAHITVASIAAPQVTAVYTVAVTSGVVSAEGVKVLGPSGTELQKVDLEIDKTLALSAQVLPAEATDKSVRWSSGDETVATVSAGGIVTGLKKGEAVITVTTTDGGKTASVTVTVIGRQPTSVEIRDDKNAKLEAVTLGRGESVSVKGVVLPLDAEDRTSTLTVSDSEIASLENGVLIGRKAGKTTLVAKTANDIRTEIVVTVLEPVDPPAPDDTLKEYMAEHVDWGTHPAMENRVSAELPLTMTSTGAGDTPLLFSRYSPEGQPLPYDGLAADTFVFEMKIKPNPSHGDFLAAAAVAVNDTVGGAGAAFYSAQEAVVLVVYGSASKLLYRSEGKQTDLATLECKEGAVNLADGRKHYLTLKLDRGKGKVILTIDGGTPIEKSLPEGKSVSSKGGVQVMSHNTVLVCDRFDAYDTSRVLPTALTPDSAQRTMTVGDTHALSVSLTPAEGNVAGELVFTSSAPQVAAVSAAGVITAVAEGTATVTVTSKYDSGVSCTIAVTVQPKPKASEGPAPTEPANGCGCGSLGTHGGGWGGFAAIGLVLAAGLVLVRRIALRPKRG